MVGLPLVPPPVMRSLAVGPPELLETYGATPQPVRVDGTPVWCGFIATPAPAFDADAPDQAHRVLIRVRAFSCNFRDRYLLLRAYAAPPDNRPYAIGSEFVGDVVATGAEVSRVQVGDRVMADNAWPLEEPKGWRRGVPTDHASREYLTLSEEKLARVPADMVDVVAAGFSVGAQTAYSMVSKLGVSEGGHVLVTAASSNTSLFSIAALRGRRVHVYVTTSSPHLVPALRDLGVAEVFQVEPDAPDWVRHGGLWATATRLGGFDAAIDPFCDTQMPKVLPLLRHGGRYVTCGLTDRELATVPTAPGLRTALAVAIFRNLQIVGNCAGLRSHLEEALADYVAGRLPVRIDSVLSGNTAAGAFVERTFAARDRFGKVMFSYDQEPGPTREDGDGQASRRA
jgi:NADPH:quinone reductase-like Zn-dependent oxidoreductase